MPIQSSGLVFAEELKRFGPENDGPPPTEVDAFDYCKRLVHRHYENFSVASFLLPKELRKPFYAVYAYCRWSDDLADEHDGSEESRQKSLQLLDWWERELDRCFAETDDSSAPLRHPVYLALRKVVRDRRLPKKPFADLLTAFRRDQIQTRYETQDDLLDYCRYSADPVGRIILYLVYSTTNENGPTGEQLSWSDSICTGLQLANFWQDVARDRDMGRCYIPRDIADRFGVDTDRLENSPGFHAMLRELVRDARNRLESGIPLIESVPKKIRVDITLFIAGGLAVLDAIEKNDYNVLTARPVVSRWTKLRILLKACVLRMKSPR